jgi:hypothetical protein
MIEILPPLGKYKYDTGEYSQRSATLTIPCACGAAYETSPSIFGAVAREEVLLKAFFIRIFRIPRLRDFR